MTGEKELKLNISNLIYEEKIITPLESLIIPESDDEIRIKNWTLSFLKKGKNLLNLEMITDSSLEKMIEILNEEILLIFIKFVMIITEKYQHLHQKGLNIFLMIQNTDLKKVIVF